MQLNLARPLLALLLWLPLASCEKPPKLCSNGGVCCRLRPTSGNSAGRSFCVPSCKDCKGSPTEDAICPEEAENVSKGCQGGRSDLELPGDGTWTNKSIYSGGLIHRVTFEKLDSSLTRMLISSDRNSSEKITRVVASKNFLDCQVECDAGTANCEKAVARNSDTRGLSVLFRRVMQMRTGRLSRAELMAMFGQNADDPCMRGDTILSKGEITNAGGRSCGVETSFALGDGDSIEIGLEIPKDLHALYYLTDREIIVSFSGLASQYVPSVYSTYEPLEENFGGKIIELRADRAWLRAQTEKGCIAVNYDSAARE